MQLQLHDLGGHFDFLEPSFQPSADNMVYKLSSKCYVHFKPEFMAKVMNENCFTIKSCHADNKKL